jgi:hypothetical protein
MSKYIYNTRLKGGHKVFSNELCDKYDIPARNKIKEALGDFVKDNPDTYKQDLVITDKNFKYKYIELQVCTTWVNDKFPHDNVYIYERKNVYGKDTLFMTLDKHMTEGYLFDGTSYDKDNPRRFKKWSREFVYDIPWNKVMRFSTDKITPENLSFY